MGKVSIIKNADGNHGRLMPLEAQFWRGNNNCSSSYIRGGVNGVDIYDYGLVSIQDWM